MFLLDGFLRVLPAGRRTLHRFGPLGIDPAAEVTAIFFRTSTGHIHNRLIRIQVPTQTSFETFVCSDGIIIGFAADTTDVMVTLHNHAFDCYSGTTVGLFLQHK
jgi:hypothetical protein